MTNKLKMLAAAAVMAVAGTAASAATVAYSEDPVFVGGFPKLASFTVLSNNEDWDTGFSAGEDLKAFTTVTQNRLIPLDVFYSLDGGATKVALAFTPAPDGSGSASLSVIMEIGDTLDFYVEGFTSSKPDATLMTFNTTTTAVPVPAAGFLLVGGLGALAATRRRKKS